MNVLKPHLQTTIWTLLRAGNTQREIERRTGISRHTIRAWADTHRPAWAVFEQPHDHPLAFYNANTLQELQQLEQWCAPPSSPP